MAQNSYDVIIVGSGAGGGMATFQLANAGLRVALVEAVTSMTPLKRNSERSSAFPGNHPGEERAPEDAHLAILMLASVAGI